MSRSKMLKFQLYESNLSKQVEFCLTRCDQAQHELSITYKLLTSSSSRQARLVLFFDLLSNELKMSRSQ